MKEFKLIKKCKLCPYRMVYDWAMLPRKARDPVMSFVEYLNDKKSV